MVRVAINGFGRIGRNIFRAGWKDPQIEFVVINDLTDTHTLAHLLKYDSVHGRFKGEISYTKDSLIVDGREIRVTVQKDINKVDWRPYGVDVVMECTGLFTDRTAAEKHITVGGAKKVLISAPAKDPDITIVKGVNEQMYDQARHHIVSNASCTTNCLAPMVKVLHDNFRVLHGFMTTVHADTNDQRILDLPHEDLRRARAAGMSIIPTTTGAAKAVAEVIPDLKGKLDGLAMRVPIMDGSITDFVAELERPATVEQLNWLFKGVSERELNGIMAYTEEPLVSVDIIGDPHSSIVDGLSTKSFGNLVKVVGWYDNEWGYSCRMIDVCKILL